LLKAAIEAGVAFRPSAILAGEGKTACSIRYMKMEMPSRTMIDVPTRRRR